MLLTNWRSCCPNLSHISGMCLLRNACGMHVTPGVTIWLCHMPVGCRRNSKGLYWPVFFRHSHLLPLDLSHHLKEHSEKLDTLTCPRTSYHQRAKCVWTNCTHTVKQRIAEICSAPLLKLLQKMKSAAFTATYDSGMNIDKPKRRGEVKKVQWHE